MIRRPPRSTLFPYRRSSDLDRREFEQLVDEDLFFERKAIERIDSDEEHVARLEFYALGHERRSEEHTSELQSRQYLVCRLLLEKKTKLGIRSIPTLMLYK